MPVGHDHRRKKLAQLRSAGTARRYESGALLRRLSIRSVSPFFCSGNFIVAATDSHPPILASEDDLRSNLRRALGTLKARSGHCRATRLRDSVEFFARLNSYRQGWKNVLLCSVVPIFGRRVGSR